jgi:uncharacterized RDD family membrane protein YckC
VSNSSEVVYARLLPRVQALVTDLILYFVVTVAILLVGSADLSNALIRIPLLGLISFFFLYEPLMVWRRGGTVGHLRYNLRVVSDRSGANPGLLDCVIRWFVKGVFGVFSLFFMGVTGRHQALHDLASRATVQVRDPETARVESFIAERPSPVGAAEVSAGRRIAVIVGYQILIWVFMRVPSMVFLSEVCVVENRCTEGEELAMSLNVLLWLLLAGGAVVLGWRGKLFGARGRAT